MSESVIHAELFSTYDFRAHRNLSRSTPRMVLPIKMSCGCKVRNYRVHLQYIYSSCKTVEISDHPGIQTTPLEI